VTVIRDVRLCSQDIRDLFLGTRGDSLVVLELGDCRLVSRGNMLVRRLLVVDGHGESFDR
jgi:hypothetical protein